MDWIKAANNAQTKLLQDINASATSFVVEDASKFPDAPFRVTIDDEIMQIGQVNKATNTFASITRGIENTTATSHTSGAFVENRWTAGTFQLLVDNIEATFQSASDGKSAIATAVTGMGQSASSSDTFQTLASKIKDISKDANAAVGHVLTGRTFYQGGSKKTGTMANRGAVTITPGTSNKAIVAGYHSGQGYVKGDANLKPENIIAGKSIFGVNGSLELGKKWGYGSAPVTTPTGGSKDYDSTIEIRNLNFKPNFIWLILEDRRYAHYVNPNVYPHLNKYWGNNRYLYVADNRVDSDAGTMYLLTTTIYSDGFKSVFNDGGYSEGKGYTISWLAIE